MTIAIAANPNRLLPPEEAAELLGVKVQTLSAWRHANRHGLPYVKVGHCIRYRLVDIERWLESRTVGSIEN